MYFKGERAIVNTYLLNSEESFSYVNSGLLQNFKVMYSLKVT